MMRIDTQHVALLCQDAKLIVHSQSHFVALRRLDGEWEVNLGNKTHTWQKAVMAKQPSTGQPFLSETSKGCCVLNPEKASVFRIVRCDSGPSPAQDVLGGSRKKTRQAQDMETERILTLLDVWRMVWHTCMWEFKELSQCNAIFRGSMADLRQRWNELQHRVSASDVLGMFEGLRLRQFQGVVVPSFSWDLHGCSCLETRQFRRTRKFQLCWMPTGKDGMRRIVSQKPQYGTTSTMNQSAASWAHMRAVVNGETTCPATPHGIK